MIHYLFDLDDCIIFHQNKIKYHWISENKELTYYLKNCKAKKYVYTNGNYSHAHVILHMRMRTCGQAYTCKCNA